MTKKMFEFEKLDDGWELVEFNYKDEPRFSDIVIPSKYKFHRVKSIAPKAFSSASFIKRVVIPDSVTSIGAAAFQYCEELKEVVLPHDLKIIDYNTFKYCLSLESIEIPAKTAVIRSFAFSKCSSLERVTLPENLCVIYNGVFEDCFSLCDVCFPESEVTILGNAFKDCGELSAEVAMYSLIGANDLSKPFAGGADFDWKVALRKDVFELAIEHHSFANIKKTELFRQIIERNLIEYMPLAEGELDDKIIPELVDFANSLGKTEFTARLLNCGKENLSEYERIVNDRFEL